MSTWMPFVCFAIGFVVALGVFFLGFFSGIRMTGVFGQAAADTASELAAKGKEKGA